MFCILCVIGTLYNKAKKKPTHTQISCRAYYQITVSYFNKCFLTERI